MITEGKRSEIQELCDKPGLRGKAFEAFLRDICRVDSLEELTDEKIEDLIERCKRRIKRREREMAEEGIPPHMRI